MSKYDCPGNCPKNPFGNADYDALLKIESALDGATMQRIVRERGAHEIDSKLLGFESMAMGDPADAMIRIEDYVTKAAYYDRDEEGKTMAERWRDTGWEKLNNDSRVYMEMAEKPVPALLEISEVLDDHHMLAVDLLEPERGPIPLRDWSLASQASRFDVLFGWTRRLPDEIRLRGNPQSVRRGRVLQEFSRELGEAYRKGGQAALADRFLVFVDRLYTITEDDYEERIDQLDPHWCRSIYRVNAAAQKILRWFEKAREFDEAHDEPVEPELQGALARFDWLRRGRWQDAPRSSLSSNRISSDGKVEEALGMVSFYGDTLMLENAGQRRHAYLREQLEGHLGDLVVFDREVVQEFQTGSGGEIADAASGDARPEPRQLTTEQEAEALGAFLVNHYRKLLDDPVPYLGDRTPRAMAASKDSADQGLLREWAKDFVNGFDRKRNRGEPVPDMDWFFRELGLEGLCSRG